MSYELCKCKADYGGVARFQGVVCRKCGRICLSWSPEPTCSQCGKEVQYHCETELQDCFAKSRESRLISEGCKST